MTATSQAPATSECPACGGGSARFVHRSRDWLVSRAAFAILECDACGLRRTDPAPPEDEIGRYYDAEDYVGVTGSRAGALNRVYHVVRWGTVRWRARIAAAAAGVRRGRVIDVGCGTGEFVAQMAKRGWTAYGVEPHPGARRLATTCVQRFPHATVLDVPAFRALTAERFDVATLWQVIEHVHDPSDVVARLGRLLAPNGALVIACPNWRSFDAGYYGADWYGYDPPRHLWHFRPEAMRRLLAGRGFQVDAMRTLPLDPYYLALLGERYVPRGVPLLHPLAIAFRSMVAGLRDVTRSSTVVYVARRSTAPT
jgi:2-polyprenyl-3-methyl-5-hydroxy-6-metoxy-1,4-benzoquinol methylase